MSSNAAARKRRTGPIPDPQPVQRSMQSTQTPPANTGLTLQQVISILDKRITTLEGSFEGIKQYPGAATTNPQDPIANQMSPANVQSYLDEFEGRFGLLADEIANLKNIVLSLQTYTMDVNKVLMEDRLQFSNNSAIETSPLASGSTDQHVTFQLESVATDN